MSEPILRDITPDNNPSREELYAVISALTSMPVDQLRRVVIVMQVEVDGKQGIAVGGQVGNTIEVGRFLTNAANVYADMLADELTRQITSGLDPTTATPLDLIKRMAEVFESHEMQGMEIPDD